MFNKIQEIFSIPELKRRVMFTLGLLVVYRVGSHITTPGVDASVLTEFFARQRGTILGLYDLFAGGNLEKATIFALGIMPYISASIILQLFQAVIPYFEKLAKEGEEGRKKITQYTRYGTVVLSIVQGFGIAIFLESMKGPSGQSAVMFPGWGFRLLTVLTLTCGTIFVMWLGEQINDRGIGNGISLIITIGILARYPIDALNTYRALTLGADDAVQARDHLDADGGDHRGCHLRHPRATTNTGPVRQARSGPSGVWRTSEPHSALGQHRGRDSDHFRAVLDHVPGHHRGAVPGRRIPAVGASRVCRRATGSISRLYSLIIIFFTYFYTAIVLNPVDLADNMKKSGGFIPGIRPGKRTAEYIDRILTRITLPGAFFLAFIAVLPDILITKVNVPFHFGGTGLLIVVGVMLDTLRQIESHLLMRHYEGFVKHGRLRGRRS